MGAKIAFKALGVRHRQIALLFGSLFMFISVRSSMYVGIVAMTDTTQSHPITDWTTSQKGIVLGFYSYGLLIFCIPSAMIANKFSARQIFGLSGLMSGLINLSLPVVTKYAGFIGCCSVRALIGALQGFVFPCIYKHLANWSVPAERPFFLACAYTGIPLGSIAMENSAGLFASHLGWPYIFYASGICYVLWSMWWYICARDTPGDHETISVDEKSFIQSQVPIVSDQGKKTPIPWMKIWSNGPFLALIVSHVFTWWGIAILDTMLPMFLKGVFHFDISTNGILSSLPTVATLVTSIAVPFIGKFISSRLNLSLTFQRKLWSSIAIYGEGIAFLILSQITLGPISTLSIFIAARSVISWIHLGIMGNEVDLSPNFAAILKGITGLAESLPGLIAPIVTGYMLHDEGNASDWSRVFLVAAVISFIGITVYVIFGSAKTQNWNSPTSELISVTNDHFKD